MDLAYWGAGYLLLASVFCLGGLLYVEETLQRAVLLVLGASLVVAGVRQAWLTHRTESPVQSSDL